MGEDVGGEAVKEHEKDGKGHPAKKGGMLAIMLDGSGSENNRKHEHEAADEEEHDEDAGMHAAAEDLVAAVHAKDAKVTHEALQSYVRQCIAKHEDNAEADEYGQDDPMHDRFKHEEGA